MIPHQPANQATTNAKSVDYTIDANEHMFRMLTKDVYNNPLLAVVREWSTNAVDACIESKKPVNFDVHIPTPREPVFYVRDYGSGLSQHQIETLFSSLGTSTKRTSNTTNGTFGIGRMSGLAYAESFTVDSYHDGLHHTYTTSFVEGSLKNVHLNTSPTSEPNGLKMSLSVDMSDIKSFREAATSIYRNFEVKPTLNVELEIERNSTSDLSANWYVDNQLQAYENYVLMSNVLYTIPRSYDLPTKGFRQLVLKVPNGKVAFNPGRESLNLDKQTIAYLKTRFEEAVKDFADVANNAITKATTPIEKIKTSLEVRTAAPSYDVNTQITLTDKLTSPFSDAVNTNSWYAVNLSPIYQKYNNAFTLHTKEYHRQTLNSLHRLDSLVYPPLLIDVKTRYSDVVKSFNKALVLRHNKDVDFNLYLLEAKRFLADIGITEYTTASSLQKTVEKTETASRKGVYLCPISHQGSVYKSKKHDSTNTEELWAFPVSGSNIETPDTEDFFRLYQLLPGDKRKKLVGVQKKYTKAVSELDYVKPAKDRILETLKQEDTYINDNLVRAYETYTTTPVLPSKLKETVAYYKSVLPKYPKARNKELIELLNKYEIPYEVLKAPYNYSELLDAYPTMDIVSNKYLDSSEVAHLMQLENAYEIYSDS